MTWELALMYCLTEGGYEVSVRLQGLQSRDTWASASRKGGVLLKVSGSEAGMLPTLMDAGLNSTWKVWCIA